MPDPAPTAAPLLPVAVPEPPTLGARLAARLVYHLAFVLLGATLRLRWSGGERFREVVRSRRPTILVAWHHQLFLVCWLIWKEAVLRGLPVVVLISRSRDGTLGTEVGRLLRARVVRGSTSRGGGPALRQLTRALAAGSTVLVIPDGPRGPARECKPGVVALGELAGVPVLPLALSVDRGWRLRSWDRMVVPKPFARVRVEVGEERLLGRLDEAGREPARLALAGELDRLSAVATAWEP